MRKRQADAAAEPPAPPQELSEELVNANALLMWVDNGRPEGAEFGRASRDLLEAELKSGRSVLRAGASCEEGMIGCPVADLQPLGVASPFAPQALA